MQTLFCNPSSPFPAKKLRRKDESVVFLAKLGRFHQITPRRRRTLKSYRMLSTEYHWPAVILHVPESKRNVLAFDIVQFATVPFPAKISTTAIPTVRTSKPILKMQLHI